MTKTSVLIFFLLVLAGLLLFAPVRLPSTINAPGRVLPASVWMVTRQPDGSIGTVHYNYRSGQSDHLMVYHAERGDLLKFQYRPCITHGETLDAGDTLGLVQSSLLDERITELRGELEVLQATLQAQKTGEKTPIVKEAQNRLELAREEAAVQQRLLERQKALFQKNLISEEEFELTRGRARVAALEVQAAEAHLAAVQTGERPEDQEVSRSRIRAIQSRIDALERRLNHMVITTPIAGKLSFRTGGDTLCTVKSQSTMVVLGVRWKYREAINLGSTVTLDIPSMESVTGTIIRIEEDITQAASEQIFPAYVKLDTTAAQIPNDLIAVGEIAGTELTPIAYLQQFIRHNLTR